MTRQLHDTGEEYMMDKLSGETFSVGLFNDSTDALSDSSDIDAISTEPSGPSYARQSSVFTSSDASGDWAIDNDSKLTFDTSDSSATVDSYFVLVTYTADDTGDAGDNDHLLFTGALDSARDLSAGIDTLEIAASGTQLKLS